MEKIDLTPSQVDFLKSFLKGFSLKDWGVELAGRAASQRYFVRVKRNDRSLILVVWDSRDEDWERFLTMERELSSQVDFLPRVYKSDDIHGLILEEDLGSMTLKRYSAENSSDPQKVMAAYRDALRSLHRWQEMDISSSWVLQSRKMDRDTFLWESSYFSRFCVTEYCACERFLDQRWERERQEMASFASELPCCCIHRDFQSENVMIHDGRIRFVDYQGARLGPPEYDTASLLFDPYVKNLDDMTEELFSFYQELLGKKDNNHAFYICTAQRLMQALGAYGNLSLHKGKEWYREYIPVALYRLIAVLKLLPEYPRMRDVAEGCFAALHD